MDQGNAGSTRHELMQRNAPIVGEVVHHAANGMARKPLGEVTDADATKSLAIRGRVDPMAVVRSRTLIR